MCQAGRYQSTDLALLADVSRNPLDRYHVGILLKNC